MKNKEFFYQQYDKINWENQEKTKINSFVNNFIIKEIILKKKGQDISIFDIGFGIGFFFRMLSSHILKNYKNITLEGCEPSEKNYKYLAIKKPLKVKRDIKLKIYNKTFLDTKIDNHFDFITSIYVFPHFISDELEEIAKKIHSMLNKEGKFILVVADEKYLEKKLNDKKDLFLERGFIDFNGKKYKEVLHYSDIPKIGKVIDYNREEQFYIDLFKKYELKLVKKDNLDDNGFICTVFVFER